MLQALTRPQDGLYGIAAPPQNAYGLVSTPQLAMFNVPNNWSVDADGKFTKDLETDSSRRRWSSCAICTPRAYIHPDSPNYNTTSVNRTSSPASTR